MKELRIEPQGEGRFALHGELNFDNVPSILAESAGLFADAPALVLDLNGVTHSNSAGLALLIEWLRLAHQQQKPFSIQNLPEQMRVLISASDLDEVLPLG